MHRYVHATWHMHTFANKYNCHTYYTYWINRNSPYHTSLETLACQVCLWVVLSPHHRTASNANGRKSRPSAYDSQERLSAQQPRVKVQRWRATRVPTVWPGRRVHETGPRLPLSCKAQSAGISGHCHKSAFLLKSAIFNFITCGAWVIDLR